METIFLNRRSEITAIISQHAETYRTRVNCNCRYPFNFRHGALVVTNVKALAMLGIRKYKSSNKNK